MKVLKISNNLHDRQINSLEMNVKEVLSNILYSPLYSNFYMYSIKYLQMNKFNSEPSTVSI